MTRTERSHWIKLGVGAGACGLLLQAGCVGALQNEIEALLAPVAIGNALAVLNSVLFDILAPLLY